MTKHSSTPTPSAATLEARKLALSQAVKIAPEAGADTTEVVRRAAQFYDFLMGRGENEGTAFMAYPGPNRRTETIPLPTLAQGLSEIVKKVTTGWNFATVATDPDDSAGWYWRHSKDGAYVELSPAAIHAIRNVK